MAWLGWESASQPKKGIYEMNLKPGVGIGDRAMDWIRNPANGHYYRLTEVMSWHQGHDLAAQWGGYLATLNDAAENSWAYQTFGMVGSDYFIGANDIANEGAWLWEENDANFWNGDFNGAVVPPWFANWRSGEPNDSGAQEDCAHVYAGTGLWNDLLCDATRRCLVESDTGKITYTGPIPSGANVTEGSHIVLSVQVRHPWGEVTYQWTHDGEPIPEASDAEYTIAEFAETDAGLYTCIISDESPATVETGPASLTFVPLAQIPAYSALGLGLLSAACAFGAAVMFRRRAPKRA